MTVDFLTDDFGQIYLQNVEDLWLRCDNELPRDHERMFGKFLVSQKRQEQMNQELKVKMEQRLQKELERREQAEQECRARGLSFIRSRRVPEKVAESSSGEIKRYDSLYSSLHTPRTRLSKFSKEEKPARVTRSMM